MRVGLTDPASVRDASAAVLAAARPDDGDIDLLVAHMVEGSRELIAGLHTDPQFGPCVMVGIGGVLTEAVADVAFRLAPLDAVDAADMLDDFTADALARSELSLLALPDNLHAALLPPRWSRGNPIDLAAAETRDTIPQILELLAAHESVDAVLFLGSGVQSNQAKLMRTGDFATGHDLERIIEFHERQDARYAQVAADVSAASGKPILVATELAVTDPDNPGPRTVRATGKVCYWSANRAVTALEHLWRRARFLDRHPRP